MVSILHKTDVGQQELRGRSHNLSRHARTLLLLADGSRDERQLLALVRGSGAADIQTLVDAGMLVRAGQDAGARPPSEPAAADGHDAVVLTYAELYDGLTALVSEQFGLIKALKFSLRIEKAQGLPALQEVARDFVDQVRHAKGDTAAARVERALSIG